MDTFWMDLLKMFLRKGASAIAAALITYGFVEADKQEWLIGGLVAFGASVAWSIYQRYKDKLVFLAALELPPGATPAQAKAAAKLDPPKLLSVVLPLLLVTGLCAFIVACGGKLPANASPDTIAAHTGADLMQVVVDAKKLVIAARKQGVPLSITDPAYGFLKQATDAADKGASAIEAYHAAASPDVRAKFKTDATAALKDVESLLRQALGISFPDGLVSEALKLQKTVQEIVTSLRGELSAAAWTQQEVWA